MRTSAVETCEHRHHETRDSNGNELACCRMLDSVMGCKVLLARSLCERCIAEGIENPPAVGNQDLLSLTARRLLLKLVSHYKPDKEFRAWFGKSRAQAIAECRRWGYSEEEIGAALLRALAWSDRVEECVTQAEVIEAARESRLYGGLD